MTGMPGFDGSRLARDHAAAAREGELTLQQCPKCHLVQYPFREVCAQCLGAGLEWRAVSPGGRVIAAVRVHASMHAYFRDNAPWRICSVILDAGPRVLAHAGDPAMEPGCRVEVSHERAGASAFVLVARRAS